MGGSFVGVTRGLRHQRRPKFTGGHLLVAVQCSVIRCDIRLSLTVGS